MRKQTNANIPFIEIATDQHPALACNVIVERTFLECTALSAISNRNLLNAQRRKNEGYFSLVDISLLF